MFARGHNEFAVLTGRYQLLLEAAIGVQLGRGLRHGVLLLFHGGEIDHILGHLAVHHLTIRRFDEAILVHPGKGGQRVDQTDVRAFRRFNRADTAIVGGVNVADFEAGALTGKTARPERRHAALVGDFGQRVGLIHELRKLAGAEELAHGGHGGLGVDQVVGHDSRDVHARHTLLDGALHTQEADAVLVFQQFADRAHAAVAEVVDIVNLALAVLEVHQFLDDREDILGAQGGDRVLAIKRKTHVQLHTAHSGKVVAVAIEEQAGKQGLGGLARWRLAGAHNAIDVGQGVVAIFGLVGGQCVADPRANAHMVDVEQGQTINPGGIERGEIVGRNFLARLDIDAAGCLIDDIAGRIAAEDFLGGDQQLGKAILLGLVGGARRNLGAGGEDHLARFGINDVEGRLGTAPLLHRKGHAPASAKVVVNTPAPRHRLVEVVEDILVTQAQRVQQRGNRQLALAVDTDIDDVLGIEFKIEPRTAIGYDAGGKQILARRVGFAAIVIEQHARAAVHLADDHALGAVDDKGAVLGHQGHVAHVDILLLDIEHGAGFGFGIHLEHDQAQRHLHGGGIGDAALAALGHIILGVFQLVVDEVQLAGAGKVADREHRTQGLFQAGNIADRRVGAQELLIALALHLDEVGHLHHFVNVTEDLADALLRRSACRVGLACHGGGVPLCCCGRKMARVRKSTSGNRAIRREKGRLARESPEKEIRCPQPAASDESRRFPS